MLTNKKLKEGLVIISRIIDGVEMKTLIKTR